MWPSTTNFGLGSTREILVRIDLNEFGQLSAKPELAYYGKISSKADLGKYN